MPRRKRTTKRKTAVARRRTYRRSMRGRGFMSFLKGANRFLKKTKLLSRGGKALSMLGVPYAGTAGRVAGAVGYGKRRSKRRFKRVVRRRKRGRGASLAGGRYRKGGGVFLAGRGLKKKPMSRAVPRGIAY